MKFDLDRYNEYANRGFCSGWGDMASSICVEAAVSIALGEGYKDKPSCVDMAVNNLTIMLNDMKWSTPQARTASMRSLGLAGLGTADKDVSFRFNFIKKYLEKITTTYLIDVIEKGAVDYPRIVKQARNSLHTPITLYLDEKGTQLWYKNSFANFYTNLANQASYLMVEISDHHKNSRMALSMIALQSIAYKLLNNLEQAVRDYHDPTSLLIVFNEVITSISSFITALAVWTTHSQLLPITTRDYVYLQATNLAIEVLTELGHTNEFEELWSKKPAGKEG